MMMNVKTRFLFAGLAACAQMAFADQPPPSSTPTNSPCQDGPKMANGKPVEVATPLDSGFVSLFNGTDLTGWWENCATHTADTQNGGVWWVDPVQHLLYSREEGPNGDILVTNQNYDNYEFILDVWPVYGNDGGIFNRVTKTGKCWQTTIDYITGSSVAGSYNEGLWSETINDDPMKFNNTSGVNNPDVTTWTTFTKPMNPASFGCSANGCIGTDFPKVWNTNGWNQMRVKFYGGLATGQTVKMETWIRKAESPEVPWVPVYKAEKNHVVPAGPVALQIHGGGRWKAGTYNIYRNIKIRKLDDNGNPLVVNAIPLGGPKGMAAPALRILNGALVGRLDADYDITIRDVQGNVTEEFRAGAGDMHHVLGRASHGVLIAELKSARGASRLRLSRI